MMKKASTSGITCGSQCMQLNHSDRTATPGATEMQGTRLQLFTNQVDIVLGTLQQLADNSVHVKLSCGEVSCSNQVTVQLTETD